MVTLLANLNSTFEFQSLLFDSSACAVSKFLLTVDLNEFRNLSCRQVVTYLMS